MDYSPLVLEQIYEWQQCFIQLIVEDYEITESEYDCVSFEDVMSAFQKKTRNNFDIRMFNDHLNELGITLKRKNGVNYLVGLRPKYTDIDNYSSKPKSKPKKDYYKWVWSLLSMCGVIILYTKTQYNEH